MTGSLQVLASHCLLERSRLLVCIVILASVTTIISACTITPSLLAEQTLICRKVSQTVLQVAGPTDHEMKTCLRENLNKEIKVLRLTSGGGSASLAMDIGEMLAARPLKIIVSEQCASSCANYLLPVAAEIYVDADSLIMLHGSIDEGFVANARTIQSDTVISEFESLQTRQDAYALRFKIPGPWLLERESYASFGSPLAGLTGQFSDFHRETSKRSKLLPGPDFVKSCFPHVEISFSDRSLAIKALNDVRVARRLARQGYFSSGTARCAL